MNMRLRFWLGLTLIVVVFAVLMLTVPHTVGWFFGVLPTPAGTSPMYQLWSGFIPATAIIAVVYPFINCHVEACWRIGRYKLDGYKVCYLHHPNPEIKKHGVSHLHIKKVHEHGE